MEDDGTESTIEVFKEKKQTSKDPRQYKTFEHANPDDWPRNNILTKIHICKENDEFTKTFQEINGAYVIL